MDFLASFDKFGAVYKPKIKQEQKNYQTVFGGIISIMIYMFGKNEVNPIQSIAYEYTQNLTMADNKDFLSFEVLGTQINPFNRTSQILVPMMIFQGYEQMEQQAFFTQDDIYNNNEVDFDIQKYTPKNISLQNGVGDYPHKVLIVLRICDSKTQTNCADDAVIDSFFKYQYYYTISQNNLLIRTTVQTEQYNSFHRSINNMSTEMIFALDRSATFYQRVIMQAQLLEIDEAPLFPTYDSKWIFSDQFIQTQSLGQSFKSNFPALFITELSMSSVTQKKVVQYIKVSQVLADVGSIFSSLMLFSIIISTFNEFLMEQELIKQVIEIYYPQFSKFEFRRLLNFGPISEVRFEGKTVDLDQFQKFYENAKTIAKNKLTVHNSIYQTSRLQFAIQGLVAREALKKLKSQGIKLNLNYDNNFKSPRENQVQGSKSSVIEYQEIEDHVNLQFTDGDFNLLDEEDNSQHEKQKINEENQENH